MTNSWAVLIRKTSLLFHWLSKMIMKKQGVLVANRDLAIKF